MAPGRPQPGRKTAQPEGARVVGRRARRLPRRLVLASSRLQQQRSNAGAAAVAGRDLFRAEIERPLLPLEHFAHSLYRVPLLPAEGKLADRAVAQLEDGFLTL